MSRRRERLNAQFRREVAEILSRRVRDPRVTDVRVTDAEVSPDLWIARIFVRVPADPGPRREAMKGLEAATPYIRRELAQTLRLRRVPELRFEPDDTEEAAQRIEALLKDVVVEEEPDSEEGSRGEGS